MKEIAVVTGGTSGIGQEIVRALAQRSFHVLTCGSRAKAQGELHRLANVEYRSCDLSTSEGCLSLARWVGNRASELRYLFNNAGVQTECEIGPSLPASIVEREIAINLTAPILLSAALVPLLETGKGCVVNLSSGLALAPKARSPIYCATKAALSSYSQTLRFQLAPRGVRVVDVITPLVRTPMTEGRHDGAMDAADFCRRMFAAIERGEDEVYVGKTRLLPTLLRITPSRVRRLMKDA